MTTVKAIMFTMEASVASFSLHIQSQAETPPLRPMQTHLSTYRLLILIISRYNNKESKESISECHIEGSYAMRMVSGAKASGWLIS